MSVVTKRQHRDGHLVDVLIYGVPVLLDNRTISIYGVYVDITERKRLRRNWKFAIRSWIILFTRFRTICAHRCRPFSVLLTWPSCWVTMTTRWITLTSSEGKLKTSITLSVMYSAIPRTWNWMWAFQSWLQRDHFQNLYGFELPGRSFWCTGVPESWRKGIL